MEIARSSTGIHVCQRKYALDLLDETGLLGCRPSSIPMDPHIKFSKDSGGDLVDAEPYRRLIGKLMYLQITRPDITFAVNKLSQFSCAPMKGSSASSSSDSEVYQGHCWPRPLLLC